MSGPTPGLTQPPVPVLEHVDVVRNERVAEGVGLLVLEAPRIAARVSPGQFIHLRISTDTQRLLRRPFSVHRVHRGRLEILYQVLGPGTRELSMKMPGQRMDAIGPLGQGWRIPDDVDHALLVAGGLGAAPLGALAEALADRGVAATVALGAPTAERLLARDVFDRFARRIELATDDGSLGHHGFVTQLVEGLIADDEPDVVYVCGPEVMARIVCTQAADAGLPCQVSLERLMACGVGACLSCVVSTTTGLKRACHDGPVFDAEEVLWDAAEVPPRH